MEKASLVHCFKKAACILNKRWHWPMVSASAFSALNISTVKALISVTFLSNVHSILCAFYSMRSKRIPSYPRPGLFCLCQSPVCYLLHF